MASNRVIKCPICFEFGSVSIDAVIQHLQEHDCDLCASVHYKPNREKYCRKNSRKQQYHYCWKLPCESAFADLNSLIGHLLFKHRCGVCRNISCDCPKDEEVVLQAGGGDQPGHSSPKKRKKEKPSSASKRPRSPSPEQEPPKRQKQDPPSETPEPSKLKPLKANERDEYYRLRDSRCPYCLMGFESKEACQRHCVHAHPEKCENLDKIEGEDPIALDLTRSAFDDAYQLYEVNLDNVNVEDINAMFMAIRRKYKKLIKKMLKKLRNFKMQFKIKCRFYRDDGGFITHAFVPMESFNFVIENHHYANFAFNTALSNFNVRIEDFQENGSGWIFQRLNEFSILFSEYPGFSGGMNFPLPADLYRKRYNLVNVPGDDGLCFKRCLMAYMYKHELAPSNRRRTLLRNQFYDDREERINKDLNFDGIHFPFDIRQVAKFERQNPDYGLNIYVYDERPDEVHQVKIDTSNRTDEDPQPETPLPPNADKESDEYRKKILELEQLRKSIYPIAVCKEEKKHVIDIMLIQNGDQGHYVLIENLLGLLRHPHSSNQTIICRYCLQGYHLQAKTHKKFCTALGRMRTDFPKDDILKWKKYKNTIPLLFLGAMDFESRLAPIDITKGNIRKIRHHKAAGYAWAICDKDGNLVNSKRYVAQEEAEDVAEKMLLELLKEAEFFAKTVNEYNKTANTVASASNSKAPPIQPDEVCKFCDTPIFADGNDKYVRHHDHFPDYKFQFYAHTACNAAATTKAKLVVLAHNLRGYDSHFLIKACARNSINMKIEVIGSSSEKFFAVMVGDDLMFIDSLNFFSSSLEAVAATMNKETDFKLSREYFKPIYKDDDKVNLMLRKGVYPYDYFTDLSKYNETQLPPPEAFYDTLSKKDVDMGEYAHAQNVWKRLKVKDLREYTELYNISDVLLLLDCFNKLRKVFMSKFGLDPAHYFSLPHLTWECALKYTKAELEYIKDETMMAWLESGVRGGVASGLEYRTAKANSPFLPDYNSNKPHSYIMVHDVNNLYGTALCTHLPTRDFNWVDDSTLNDVRKDPKEFIDHIPDEGDKGYYFEVDLTFPESIHDDLKGLTPVPYKRIISDTELSPGQQELAEQLGVTEATMNAPRLVTDLHPKKNYVVHYRVLKFYLSLGIQVSHIHRGVSFTQTPVLRPYLLELAQLRKEAKGSKFEQNMWKLAANACYGKSVESVRNRCSFVIVRDRKTALKYNKKPTVAQVILLDTDKEGEDIAIIRLKKLHVVLDKPIYLGITVLDESKRILYEWYYNYAKPKWGNKIHALATDTDSVISLIETDDVYLDMFDDKHMFDMSDFDTEKHPWSKYHCPENHKKLGVMKDENPNRCVSSFIFLRPKMYVYDYAAENGLDVDGSNKYLVGCIKKAKGLNRQCVKQNVSIGDYQEALEKPIQKQVTCTTIRSEKHELYTMEVTKKGLSSFDQKRYILPDGISTLPFGHYLISHEDNAPQNVNTEVEDEQEVRT